MVAGMVMMMAMVAVGGGDGDGDNDDGSDGDKLTTTTAIPVHRNHSSLFFRKITESKPTKIMIEPGEEEDGAFVHGSLLNLCVRITFNESFECFFLQKQQKPA